jgi:hypothetical protein
MLIRKALPAKSPEANPVVYSFLAGESSRTESDLMRMHQSPMVAGLSPFQEEESTMTYWSFETLNQDLEKTQGVVEGKLYLSRYVTLEPGTREAEEILRLLEEAGYLPLTVAWISEQGQKVRLFLAPEGIYSFAVSCNGVDLELHTGRGDFTLVACQRWRRGSYEVSGDPSFLIMNPVKLPRVTFEFLQLLALIPPRSIDLRPQADPGESGS